MSPENERYSFPIKIPQGLQPADGNLSMRVPLPGFEVPAGEILDDVLGNPAKPSKKGAVLPPAEILGRLPRSKKSLLKNVIDFDSLAEPGSHPQVDQALQPVPIKLDELGKRAPVPHPRSVDQVLCHLYAHLSRAGVVQVFAVSRDPYP